MSARSLPTLLAASAVCVAVLGATPVGHAAKRLVVPKNSVGTAQIRTSAVTAAKIKPGSLTPADFGPLAAPAGPAGDKGAAGPQGGKGDNGRPSLTGFQVVQGTLVTIGPGVAAPVSAVCPAGTHVVSGGFDAGLPLELLAQLPATPAEKWVVSMRNAGAQPASFRAYAICVTKNS